MKITGKQWTIIGIIVAILIGVPSLLPLRPTVNIYLENEQKLPTYLVTDFNSPPPSLQYTTMTMSNVGKLSAAINVTIISNNATVSFDKQSWSNSQSRSFLLNPDSGENPYEIYVKPDSDVNQFELTLRVVNPYPILQQINQVNLQNAVFHKTFDGGWEWSP